MPALSIKNLKKTYENKVEALKGIDLEVDKGDFFGLLGANGAGKTTIIGIVTSLVNKTSGSVKVFGVDIDKDFDIAKTFIGVVPQEMNFSIFEKTLDIVVQQAGYYGIPKKLAVTRAEELLKDLGIWDKRDEVARTLSGGMKRRLMIARGLIHQPKLLMLDEPTAGVDVELRRGMYEFLVKLNKEGTTIILTTHYLEEAEQMCDKIAIINKGRIVENTTKKELLRRLNKETFVMDLKDPITDLKVDGYDVKMIDSTALEVVIEKKMDLNDFFKVLDKKKIKVLSMRSKTNRLEEFFLGVVEHGS